MRVFEGAVGVDGGEHMLFADHEDGGEMWTGDGTRTRRHTQAFSKAYKTPPFVQCSISLWDTSKDSNVRMDIQAENVTEEGFEMVFTTWSDTHVARIRVSWFAIGELDLDDWEL